MGIILPLRLQQVSYKAADSAQWLLRDISLEIEPGLRYIGLGPNGAGKSLLLRLCHGLLTPSSGSILWSDTDHDAVRQQQAMVFQRPVLLRRSVLANVNYALAVRGVPWRNRRQLSLQALAKVNLSHLASRPARVLSGGEQQRLALARAWALRPQILFLDEPTANLDPGATRLIEQAITSIFRSGTTIVMTTHDLGQARRNADRVFFLYQGRLLEETGGQDFFEHPATVASQRFLAGELLD